MHRSLPWIVACVYTVLAAASAPAAHASRDRPATRRPPRATAPAPPASAGTTRILQLATAPNPSHPEVLVHAPAGFDPRGPVHVAVFLHGWNNCVRVLAGSHGADLVAQFDRAGVNALLVLPQFAFDMASSDPGRLGEPGAFRAMLADVLSSPELSDVLGGPRALLDLGRVVVLAHSGGFVAAANVLAHGQVDVHELHLLDALYHDLPAFESWARAHIGDFTSGRASGRRLVSLWTTERGPGRRSHALVSRIARALPEGTRSTAVRDDTSSRPLAPALLARPLVAQRTAVAHGEIPEVFLASLLRTAGLPAIAPPVATGNGPPPSSR